MRSGILIHPEELSREWIDKAATAKIHTLALHPGGGENADLYLKRMLDLLETPEYRGMIDYAKGLGLEIEYELHSIGYLLERELFSSHPEYFRMNENGERTNDFNLCVSNEDALGIVAKKAAFLASKLYGSGHDYYFWLDDGHGLHCQCPKCKSLSPSDQQLTVLNRMLSEIKKIYPDARMAYLAYMDSVLPPKQVKAAKGIFLEYAPFEKYTAKGDDAPMLILREKNMLNPLLEFFDGDQKKVLEYWYDNSLLSGWKKPPKPFSLKEEEMIADIKEYTSLGFDSIATFACFLGEDYRTLYGDVDVTPFSNAVLG